MTKEKQKMIDLKMEDFVRYLQLAPVSLTIWLTLTAAFIIEINRFFPDGLFFDWHGIMKRFDYVIHNFSSFSPFYHK